MSLPYRESTRRAVASSPAAAGVTAILVTHDQGEALSLPDQVAVQYGWLASRRRRSGGGSG